MYNVHTCMYRYVYVWTPEINCEIMFSYLNNMYFNSYWFKSILNCDEDFAILFQTVWILWLYSGYLVSLGLSRWYWCWESAVVTESDMVWEDGWYVDNVNGFGYIRVNIPSALFRFVVVSFQTFNP